jgi:hypothetical protein
MRLLNDSALRQAMDENGKACAQQHYSSKVITQKTIDLHDLVAR